MQEVQSQQSSVEEVEEKRKETETQRETVNSMREVGVLSYMQDLVCLLSASRFSWLRLFCQSVQML